MNHSHVDLALNRDVERLLKQYKDTTLPIVEAGDPVLRAQAEPFVGQLSKKTMTKLIEAMRKCMLEAPGVGLAAPQIGLSLAFAVVEDHTSEEYDDDPREFAEFPFHVIINPVYEPVGEKTVKFYEGCLSVPGFQAVRKRHLDIMAHWTDEEGHRHDEQLHGWPARIFQHETDHLSGELYIDKSEIRSLTSDENLDDYWSYDPVPEDAATELGFTL
ncbi:peptide deformylase [Bifidobacterium dolichotidis]|uniref:Peptide deformylase n=1 Tax=Bifidobacterium dolichotidis TaxID=2306976 RepID=A0A430FRS5_9BIFI|nr:peptide deformylase [Bifidobacterium dolichotidis]RSX55582.1 peptide deformylase [Bifidobacterium dolichotidis]